MVHLVMLGREEPKVSMVSLENVVTRETLEWRSPVYQELRGRQE